MRLFYILWAGALLIGAVGEWHLYQSWTTETILGKPMSRSEADASEKEIDDTIASIDPNDPNSFEKLTKMKTAGGRIVSEYVAELLRIRKQSQIDEDSMGLVICTASPSLCKPKLCRAAVKAAQSLIADEDRYCKQVHDLFAKMSTNPTITAELQQSEALIGDVAKSSSDWARASIELARFCLRHRPQLSPDHKYLLFDDAVLAEANRLIKRANDAEKRMDVTSAKAQAGFAARSGLTKKRCVGRNRRISRRNHLPRQWSQHSNLGLTGTSAFPLFSVPEKRPFGRPARL